LAEGLEPLATLQDIACHYEFFTLGGDIDPEAFLAMVQREAPHARI
jgi:hypothetical protein